MAADLKRKMRAAALFVAVLFAAALLSRGTFAAASADGAAAGTAQAGSAPAESAAREGAAPGSITLTTEYGFGNSAKGGCYLPLTVTADNAGTSPFTGKLEVLTRQADDDVYVYSFPASIGAGERKSEEYAVPLSASAEQLALRLRAEDGTVVSEQKLRLNINRVTPELFIGALTDTPEALSYLDGVSVNYGQMRSRLFMLDPESFPVDRNRLDMLDMIVISGFRMSELSVDQTRALMQWMREGGALVFGTGARVDETLGLFAPEFLDDMYEPAQETELSFDEQNADRPGGAGMTVPLVQLALHGGSTVLASDSETLITAANKGNGVLCAAGFDFCDLSAYLSSGSTFTDTIITSILGTARLDRLVSEAYGAQNDEYWAAQALIDTGIPGELPDLKILILVIALYLAMAGPLLYFAMRRYGGALYYRRAAAVLALLFTGIVFLINSRTRFQGTFYTYAMIRDVGEDAVNETAYISLRNPYNASYAVQIPGQYSVVPLTASLNQTETELTGSEEPNISIASAGGNTQISVSDVGAFSPRFFRLDRGEENASGGGFRGEIELFGERCHGSITNGFPYDVEDAAVIMFGKVVPLGRLAAGETVSVDGRVMYHIPLNDSYTVAAFLTGVYDGAATEEERLHALSQANFLSFYLSERSSGYSADARVVGFSTDDSDSLVGTKLQHSGLVLVTSAVSVDSRLDGEVYRSALSQPPRVMSGDYIAETNSFYRGELVVLAYLPGTDLRIRELRFETADPMFESQDDDGGSHSFRGTMSFYNYGTGNFDDVDPEQEIFDAEELSSYLSPDNMIMVRYAEGPDRTGTQFDIALPILSVIGEEY